MEPTKRSVVGVTARIFDPLGVLSPVTIMFKMFFQRLCEEQVGWDEPLPTDLKMEWDRLSQAFNGPTTSMSIAHCYDTEEFNVARLVGFCDASSKAYAAVVYLRYESEHGARSTFVAAKTRVAPLGTTTIPRLELMSALLLARLITSVQQAIEMELTLDKPLCFTDSQVALCWIRGRSQ